MSESNQYYKKAAQICDMFPNVDFLTLVAIIRALSTDNVSPVAFAPAPQKFVAGEVRKRKCKVRIVMNGKNIACPSRRSLMRAISMGDRYLDVFHHNKRLTVPQEAELLARAVKEKNGQNITDYYSYAFDGKYYHATLEACKVVNCQEVKE